MPETYSSDSESEVGIVPSGSFTFGQYTDIVKKSILHNIDGTALPSIETGKERRDIGDLTKDLVSTIGASGDPVLGAESEELTRTYEKLLHAMNADNFTKAIVLSKTPDTFLTYFSTWKPNMRWSSFYNRETATTIMQKYPAIKSSEGLINGDNLGCVVEAMGKIVQLQKLDTQGKMKIHSNAIAIMASLWKGKNIEGIDAVIEEAGVFAQRYADRRIACNPEETMFMMTNGFPPAGDRATKRWMSKTRIPLSGVDGLKSFRHNMLDHLEAYNMGREKREYWTTPDIKLKFLEIMKQRQCGDYFWNPVTTNEKSSFFNLDAIGVSSENSEALNTGKDTDDTKVEKDTNETTDIRKGEDDDKYNPLRYRQFAALVHSIYKDLPSTVCRNCFQQHALHECPKLHKSSWKCFAAYFLPNFELEAQRGRAAAQRKAAKKLPIVECQT